MEQALRLPRSLFSGGDVKPSHPSVGRFARSGFFDGLGRFSDLGTRVSALSTTKEMGDAFEVFVEGWIATSHRFQAKQIWPGSTLPVSLRKTFNLSASDGSMNIRRRNGPA